MSDENRTNPTPEELATRIENRARPDGQAAGPAPEGLLGRAGSRRARAEHPRGPVRLHARAGARRGRSLPLVQERAVRLGMPGRRRRARVPEARGRGRLPGRDPPHQGDQPPARDLRARLPAGEPVPGELHGGQGPQGPRLRRVGRQDRGVPGRLGARGGRRRAARRRRADRPARRHHRRGPVGPDLRGGPAAPRPRGGRVRGFPQGGRRPRLRDPRVPPSQGHRAGRGGQPVADGSPLRVRHDRRPDASRSTTSSTTASTRSTWRRARDSPTSSTSPART